MIKKIAILFVTLLFSITLWSQKTTVRGVVLDAETAEPLIGANVLFEKGVGTVTDFDGKFSMEIDEGSYNMKFSYVGYETKTQSVNASGNSKYLKVKLEPSVRLSEITVVADIARERETPVAFTNVLPAKLESQLGGQDMPMVLNTTPGVYVTQQGGGDGDAEVRIRGFNNRNIGTLLDGIPVNDMENGRVYWSNWFGLDLVTRTIQVQRGLGASKLALPSVGGTINIITKGIENKREIKVKQELTSELKSRTSMSFNSGRMPSGWGVTAAGSYKRGKGWVEGTFVEAWFYYLKLEKRLGKHILSASAMGAPQKHGQRAYPKPIAVFDREYAEELGCPKDLDYINSSYINTETQIDKGLRYNCFWGTYTDKDGTEHTAYEKLNYYHKPAFSLRDVWNISDDFYVSNILYASLGKGGGTRLSSTTRANDYDEDGQVNFQKFYDQNTDPNSFVPGEAGTYIQSSVNNHYWYGLLSTFSNNITTQFNLSGGVDLRYYKGEHYREVYDLLGAEYAADRNNVNQSEYKKQEGDIVRYHNDGLVRWGGLFLQGEFKTDRLSVFANITGAISGYKKIDYFMPMTVDLGGTTYNLEYEDTIEYQGQKYTIDSEEAEYAQSDWKNIPGYTFKCGANYNFTRNINIFTNMGYLSKAPRMSNVYEYNTVSELLDVDNEYIKAVELGINYHSPEFSANLNAYNTRWENKPSDYSIRVPINDDEEALGNIQGMDALHRGVELDFVVKVLHNLDVQGLVSIGDWRWDSGDSIRFYNNATFELVYTDYFDAKGVHVGDAAQTQIGCDVRYEPIKGLYISALFMRFDRYYADFSPESLKGELLVDENGNRIDPPDSWMVPSYNLLDFHSGYKFKIRDKFNCSVRFSMLNVLDTKYIWDARDNDSYSTTVNNHDAASAGVHFGMGRRFNISFQVKF